MCKLVKMLYKCVKTIVANLYFFTPKNLAEKNLKIFKKYVDINCKKQYNKKRSQQKATEQSTLKSKQ